METQNPSISPGRELAVPQENPYALATSTDSTPQLVQKFIAAAPALATRNMAAGITAGTENRNRIAAFWARQGIVKEHGARTKWSADIYNPYIGREQLTGDQFADKHTLMGRFADALAAGDISNLPTEEQERLREYLGYDLRASRRGVDKLNEVIKEGLSDPEAMSDKEFDALNTVLRQLTFIAAGAANIQTMEDLEAVNGLVQLALKQTSNKELFNFNSTLVGRVTEWIKEAMHGQEINLMYTVLGGNPDEALQYSEEEEVQRQAFMDKKVSKPIRRKESDEDL